MVSINDVPNTAAAPRVAVQLSGGRDQGSGIVSPVRIEKRWGHECIYTNDQYCLKTICISALQSTSMHFHITKRETLMVQEGLLELGYIDREGIERRIKLSKGQAIHIDCGFIHQLRAITDCVLVEASTFDEPHDSYRVKK